MASVFGDIGRGLSRAWENVAEGWRELAGRSSNALTRFFPRKDDAARSGSGAVVDFPRWGLLAGDVKETGRSIVVQVEIPGVERDDCDVWIENSTLFIRGEKRVDREHVGDTYYAMERAYGSFQRAIPLPRNIDSDAANASYRNGVLTVEIPKTGAGGARRLTVT